MGFLHRPIFPSSQAPVSHSTAVLRAIVSAGERRDNNETAERPQAFTCPQPFTVPRSTTKGRFPPGRSIAPSDHCCGDRPAAVERLDKQDKALVCHKLQVRADEHREFAVADACKVAGSSSHLPLSATLRAACVDDPARGAVLRASMGYPVTRPADLPPAARYAPYAGRMSLISYA